MEDCCAVCAEPLEWVAYGSCGHREVCSTCVARLRFILLDPRCCICKIESPAVYVTKAMGDYTTVISDFSVFPADAKEGRSGKYWYHEDTQSFFDDSDQYKMIKAMCRLSCNLCDKLVEEQSDSLNRKPRFKNIDQLKGHLFHKHGLFMCSLCLEGRKVFVCEQKLYTRAQLSQHTRTGDTVVDGTESERGGFMGHPMCVFCRSPFYGDNELYMHMSREHYTCHICQRQHPGQFDYFVNYDDLEMHFRNDHFLCENEACLVKKFVVFQSESEMKRHNALEHGGNMSRSKRNAALQVRNIPTSFRYSGSYENRRGRGRGRDFYNSASSSRMPADSQGGYEYDNTDLPPFSRASNVEESNYVESTNDNVNNLNITSDVEQPSRYLQAASLGSINGRLDESFFPPLPGVLNKNRQQAGKLDERGKKTITSRLQQRNKVDVLHSAQPRPSLNQGVGIQTPSNLKQSRNNEYERRRGKGRGGDFLNTASSSGMPAGSRVGDEYGNADFLPFSTAQHAQSASASDIVENSNVKAASETFNNLNVNSDVDQPSKYLQAVSQKNSRNGRFEESSFPSLPGGLSNDNRQQAGQHLEERGKNTMASRLQQRNKVDAHLPSQPRSILNEDAGVHFPALTSAPTLNNLGSTESSAQNWGNKTRTSSSSNSLSTFVSRSEAGNSRNGASASSTTSGKIGVTQSRSSPDLKLLSQPVVESIQPSLDGQDVQSANKSLVEKIRLGLGMDEEKFTAFKQITGEYRGGQIDTWEYLAYVQQFQLIHLVPELARLCPDPLKQRELMDTYAANFLNESISVDRKVSDSSRKKKGKSLENNSLKGKGKLVENGLSQSSSKKDALADNFIESVRKLQANNKPSEEVEVLSKDGYRSSKGKGSLREANSKPPDSGGHAELPADGSSSNYQSASGKQHKKTSKFQRVRLGDGSAEALFRLGRLDASPGREEDTAEDKKPNDGQPLRGVWKNNGGLRLIGK